MGAEGRPLRWWREADRAAHRALIAASLGWMLDSFDVMLFALLTPSLMAGLHLSKAGAGLLASLTLIGGAAGGLLFGVIADRYGRTRALMASIALYAVFTAACGLAQTFLELALFRVLLGFGMGGEWASGAALVSESWPAEHRGKALGLMQSSWALGYALAAIVTAVLLPRVEWRGVFFVGVIPALLTLWIRRHVPEPALWTNAAATRAASPANLLELLRPGLLPLTAAVTLMNAATLFAWWGFNSWVPAYLSLPITRGGFGFDSSTMSAFIVVMQTGMWLGYVCFGFVSDRAGRKRTYVTYLLVAAVLLVAYSRARNPVLLLCLGPLVAFFGTGYFSGFGAVTAEIYPTRIRSTGQGFAYNMGRLASAAAPLTVGSLAETHGFAPAFLVTASAFLFAAALWLFIPESRFRQLA